MAKRGYKLQEFVAHTADVNCVKIGKKGGRLIVTGGDDNKVNLWSIGRPNPLVSLSGHSTPVESVAFHSSEVLIVAGASTGVIKLWDVEETKMVGTLTGHRSYCTAVEFHSYGEFLASGSMDSNLKIWDIRKKGCIHTYKGHTRGISNIRFSPDGRWVVSGGLDNVVKVWDLTAGKLLHDFKFHEGHIRSIAFHPLEFLLATGSADRTVKFWDLETFELIGSTRPEATGVRAVTFHPDGKTLFCGLDDKLKVFSWEPVICHEAIDMGWSTLGDLCTHEGKLLGCSHYQNSVGVWVADIALIDQYELGLAPEESVTGGQNFDMLASHSSESKGDGIRSTMGLHSMFSECEEIKNIYVDCAGENNAAREKVGSLNSPKDVFSLESKEISHLPTQKHVPAKVMHMKTNEQALDNTSMVPSIVPQECPDAEDLSNHKTNSGMLVKPTHVQRASLNKYDADKLVVAIESESLTNTMSVKEITTYPNFLTILKVNDEGKISCDEKYSNIKSVAEKFDKVLSPQTPFNQGKANEESTKSSNEISSVKVVSGVAVIQGRIRSLVERFEKRENLCNTEDQAIGVSVTVTPEIDKPQTEKTPSMPLDDKQGRETLICEILEPISANDQRDLQLSRMEPTSANDERELQVSGAEPNCANDQREQQIIEKEPTCANDQREPQISPRGASFANDLRRELQTSKREQASAKDQRGRLQISQTGLTSADYQRGRRRIFGREQSSPNDQRGPLPFGREPASANNQRKGIQLFGRESNSVIVNDQREGISGREQASTNALRRESRVSRRELSSANDQKEVRVSRRGLKTTSANNQRGPQNFVRELTSANDQREPRKFGRESTPMDDQIGDFEVSLRDPISANDQNLTEDLLQTHDAFISTLRSRLTKLQVVRHYWEQGDVRGAVNGLRKLPDHSVQADVVSVLKEKMEIWTLDLFSHLLPILVGLLDSNIARHANISLEILLKLVAVFGPVISSTVSAPPSVGVDLQAEQRLECCKECFAQLQKIQQILPWFIKRGGLLARSSQELNLVLQQL